MKNLVKGFCTTAILVLAHSAHATVLNFSSGQYNQANTVYTESGFKVEASHGFHAIRLDTLAWYEGDSTLTITSQDGAFNLEKLTIVTPAFSGLTFQSSKGGFQSVGSISGVMNFSGAEWQAIDQLQIRTITHTDILNQIDNLSVTAVPEPASSSLLLGGLAALGVALKGRRHATVRAARRA